MKFLTVFFTGVFLAAIVARILCGYYVDIVPWFSEMLRPLTFICIGSGAITVGLVIAIIAWGFKK